MSRRRGNFDYNYPKVIAFLDKHDLEYVEYNDGQHLRILSPTKIVDLWPSRMTYHVIASEDVIGSKEGDYSRLNFTFDEHQLAVVLNVIDN